MLGKLTLISIPGAAVTPLALTHLVRLTDIATASEMQPGPVDEYIRIQTSTQVTCHSRIMHTYACTCTHALCINIAYQCMFTCTCTRSCKISDYQQPGFDTAFHSGQKYRQTTSIHNINTSPKGLKQQDEAATAAKLYHAVAIFV